MSNRPPWVPKLENALARGEAAYRDAAQIIITALTADATLTQAKVAEYIGHKPPWVSSLLKWYRGGCPPGGVFGPEAATRREKISTSKFPEYERWPIFDPPPVDGSEATRRVLAAEARCAEFTKEFIRTVNALKTNNVLDLAYQGDPDGRRRALKKLVTELQKSIAAGGAALSDVDEVLRALILSLDRAA